MHTIKQHTLLFPKKNLANRKNKRYNSNADNENNLATIGKQTNYRPPYIQVWYRNGKANWNVFSIIDIRVSIRVNSICQLATSSWYRNRIYTCVTDSKLGNLSPTSIRSGAARATSNIHRKILIEKKRNTCGIFNRTRTRFHSCAIFTTERWHNQLLHIFYRKKIKIKGESSVIESKLKLQHQSIAFLKYKKKQNALEKYWV